MLANKINNYRLGCLHFLPLPNRWLSVLASQTVDNCRGKLSSFLFQGQPNTCVPENCDLCIIGEISDFCFKCRVTQNLQIWLIQSRKHCKGWHQESDDSLGVTGPEESHRDIMTQWEHILFQKRITFSEMWTIKRSRWIQGQSWFSSCNLPEWAEWNVCWSFFYGKW